MISPSSLLAIDPGKRVLGWSVWTDSVLLACGLARVVKTAAARDLGQLAGALAEQVPGGADLAVVERMFQYPSEGREDSRQRQDAVANDLLDLQAIGGWVAGRNAQAVRWATPFEWKGHTPKEIIARRARQALSPEESQVMVRGLAQAPAGLRHNVEDAVALGLWHLRRLPR